MVTLKVNGRDYSYDGDPTVPLLWVLRDELGLTGTKFGCGEGLCGACTVHLDGAAIRSCGIQAGDAVGKTIVTIEGLHSEGNHLVQRVWREANVPQCGYCHAGQIMQAAALLASSPKPSRDEILTVMSGNICRCGCYQRIAEAITLASTGA
jgi:isoquinoline 1-oxidoreductase subunit alpha